MYKSILDIILPELSNQDLIDIMFQQLVSFEKSHPYVNATISLTPLSGEQFKVYNKLCNSWGKASNGKYTLISL